MQPIGVIVRKIDRCKSPVCEPGDFATWNFGGDNGHLSLPVKYEMEGTLLAPLQVGGNIKLHRTRRNDVVAEGAFTSSPIMRIEGDLVETYNSLYRITTVSV